MTKNEARKLKWTPLAPPDYSIHPRYLLDSFIEKEIKYLGCISNLSLDRVNLAKRIQTLLLIDKACHSGELSPASELCILSISALNLKISERHPPELILQRMGINQIHTFSYIREDANHFLCILFHPDPEAQQSLIAHTHINHNKNNDNNKKDIADHFQLMVLSCENRVTAEELCSLLNQCFQLVYTEATMQFFDKQLLSVSSTMSASAVESPLASCSPPSQHPLFHQQFVGAAGLNSPDPPPPPPPHNNNNGHGTKLRSKLSNASGGAAMGNVAGAETSSAASDLSSTAAELLQSYMQRLSRILSTAEMAQFAACLRSWQQGAPFEAFCHHLLDVFGADRGQLMAEMRAFIPHADLPHFEDFLATHFYAKLAKSEEIGQKQNLIN